MKTMKVRFQIVLLVELLLAIPGAVQAQFNLTFTTNNGAITITGYTGSPTVLNIPNATNGFPVTSIQDFAFENCSSLTTVTIPNGVISIGQGAFENDTALTSIIIGNGVVSIADSTFNSCQALTSVTIGYGVTSIGYFAFRDCVSLTNLIMPNSIANFSDYVFADCPKLEGIYFQGNAPGFAGAESAGDVFTDGEGGNDNSVTNYFLPGTTGWANYYNSCLEYTLIWTNLWPGAFQYTAVPTNGLIPLTVQFSSPTHDGGNSLITNWNWNFGDGTTSTNQNPTHIYTTGITGGSFSTSLLAMNSLGKTVAGFGSSIVVSPPNDNFTNRIPLSGAALGSNLGATLEVDEPNPAGAIGSVTNSTTNNIPVVLSVSNVVKNTVWWSWTAPTNGPASVLTYGSSYDTIIYVYTSNSLSSLACVTSNLYSVLDDDLSSYQNPQVGILNPANAGILNRVGFTASAGTTYQFQISGLNEGPIDISVQTIALKILSVNQVGTNGDGSVNFNAVVEVGNSGVAGSAPLQLEVLAHAGYSYDSNSGLPNQPNSLPADQVLTNYVLSNPATMASGTTTNISIFGVCPGPTYHVSNNATNWAFGWGVYAVLQEQFGTNWYFMDNDFLFYGQWPTIGGVIGQGGGVIRLNPSQLITANNPGFVEWQLAPASAVQAGAGWKLAGDSVYSTTTNYVKAVTSTNAITVEFKPIAGWNLPPNQTVTVLPGQITSQTGFYTVTNPVVMAGASSRLGISGTIGTEYRLEHRTSLTSGSWLPVSTNTILTNGFNLLLPNPSTNGSVNFYRAVWLGQ